MMVMTRALLLENPTQSPTISSQDLALGHPRDGCPVGTTDRRLSGIDYVGLRSRPRSPSACCALAQSEGYRRLLHRHQPDRPGYGRRDGHRRVQPANTRSDVGWPWRIIDLSRRVTVKELACTAACGTNADGAHRMRGRTLGIGYSSIGTQLSVLASGPQCHLLRRRRRLAWGNATQMPTMEAVLREADIISVHVDGQSPNTNDRSHRIRIMTRRPVHQSLARTHRRRGRPARHSSPATSGGAAIDVFPEEPRANGDPSHLPARPRQRHPHPTPHRRVH